MHTYRLIFDCFHLNTVLCLEVVEPLFDCFHLNNVLCYFTQSVHICILEHVLSAVKTPSPKSSSSPTAPLPPKSSSSPIAPLPLRPWALYTSLQTCCLSFRVFLSFTPIYNFFIFYFYWFIQRLQYNDLHVTYSFLSLSLSLHRGRGHETWRSDDGRRPTSVGLFASFYYVHRDSKHSR